MKVLVVIFGVSELTPMNLLQMPRSKRLTAQIWHSLTADAILDVFHLSVSDGFLNFAHDNFSNFLNSKWRLLLKCNQDGRIKQFFFL